MCILQFSSTKILAEKILFNGKSYKSTEILQIRFPYKPVYGLPEHFNCTMITKEEFEQCEIEALKAWTITIRNYFYQSKYFCCFVWCALDCEIELMNKCNETHSKYMKDSTTEWFKKACHFFDKTSAFCKIKPDFETFFYDNYVIFIILLIIVGLCTLNREYHGITRSDVLRSIEKFIQGDELTEKYNLDTSTKPQFGLYSQKPCASHTPLPLGAIDQNEKISNFIEPDKFSGKFIENFLHSIKEFSLEQFLSLPTKSTERMPEFSLSTLKKY